MTNHYYLHYYLHYLLLGILNWIGITYLFKYAIKGEANSYILLIILIVLIYFGLWGLGIAKDVYSRENLKKGIVLDI